MQPKRHASQNPNIITRFESATNSTWHIAFLLNDKNHLISVNKEKRAIFIFFQDVASIRVCCEFSFRFSKLSLVPEIVNIIQAEEIIRKFVRKRNTLL
jgi:hypothetical protein